MTQLAKLSGVDLDSAVEFTHPDVWQREDHDGWSRLVVGARQSEIPLILELCRDFAGRFAVLYVLVGSRLGRSGRFQSPEPISYDDLELFLYTHQEFFEQDGRHHLWVVSASGEGQLVFDNHNKIYAYGDLDRYETRLLSMGFRSGSVDNPSPHGHNYHPEFDSAEDEVLKYWDWLEFPLEPDDDP